jgi:hypothetical protein
VLRDSEKADVLQVHVDQLLLVCSLQFRMLLNKHIDDQSAPRETITRLFQALLATLFSVSAIFVFANVAFVARKEV